MNAGLLGFPGIRTNPLRFESEERAYAASTAYDFRLPLTRPPDGWRAVIVCKLADASYAPGDEVGMEFIVRPAVTDNCAVSIRKGYVHVVTGASFVVSDRSTGASVLGTATRWNVKIYALWLR